MKAVMPGRLEQFRRGSLRLYAINFLTAVTLGEVGSRSTGSDDLSRWPRLAESII